LHILSKWSAHQTLHIDLTSHGRNDLLGDLSLARTVGYITVSTPIVITLPQNATANRAIELVHEHLRDMPNSGIGYGILRYLRPEGPQLAALRQFSPAEVKFNFLGSLSAATSALACFQPAIVDFPGVLDPDDHRAYLHNIEIALVADKLQFEWKYSADIHRAQTIQNASCTSEPFIGRVR
jgi:non-ribosomal peptide synthase protein (TIGR01720 family)